MSDEEVRKLPEFRRTIYEEYQKFALMTHVAFLLLPSIYTMPSWIDGTKWPLYLQLGITSITSIWIFWLRHKIRRINREIMVREIMGS